MSGIYIYIIYDITVHTCIITHVHVSNHTVRDCHYLVIPYFTQYEVLLSFERELGSYQVRTEILGLFSTYENIAVITKGTYISVRMISKSRNTTVLPLVSV